MKQKPNDASAGGLSIVSLTTARMEPLEWLSEAEAAEWRAIVDSLPADYFRPADAPLLAAYCTAASLHKQAREEIKTEGMIIELDGGRKQMNPAVTVLQYQSGTMAQLSVKLRLAPSARYTPKSAGTAAGDAPKPKRPWEAAS